MHVKSMFRAANTHTMIPSSMRVGMWNAPAAHSHDVPACSMSDAAGSFSAPRNENKRRKETIRSLKCKSATICVRILYRVSGLQSKLVAIVASAAGY